MPSIIAYNKKEDILLRYQNTPIEKLLQYHNLSEELEKYEAAELIIGMCMDNRKQLRLPDNFAYFIRTGGGNLRNSEFKVSFAIAIGDLKTLALIAHNNCGMVNLIDKKDKFIGGLVKNAGWSKKKAEDHFYTFAPLFEIENEIDFVISESQRLQTKYPTITVAPLFYKMEDGLLYQIN